MKLKPELKEIVQRSGIPSESELNAASTLLQSLSLNEHKPHSEPTSTTTTSSNQSIEKNQQENNDNNTDYSEQKLTSLVNEVHKLQRQQQQTDNENETDTKSESSSEEGDPEIEISNELALNIESSSESEEHDNSETSKTEKSHTDTQSNHNEQQPKSTELSTSELNDFHECNESNEKRDLKLYDPFKRDPQYANSKSVSLWELV
jgi:hypothetical protein